MAEKSFKWAAEKGRVRKNVVHGEEEAKLVLRDAFSVNEQDGHEMTGESSFTVEDSGTTLFGQDDEVDDEHEVDGAPDSSPNSCWFFQVPSSFVLGHVVRR